MPPGVMSDWKHYWDERPRQFSETDFLRQIGRTVGGVPLSTAQVTSMVEQVVAGLDLHPDDTVLDLCCGNGLITWRLAQVCQQVVGVDFSERLIEIARKYWSAANTYYIHAGVLDLRPEQLPQDARINKVLMYEALQHFKEDQLSRLLRTVASMAEHPVTFYFGGVPDKDRIWNFYNTAERRQEYHRRMAEGTEAIGTWWSQQFIVQVAEAGGYLCRIISQPSEHYSAHYRFDVLLTPQGLASRP